MRARQWRRQRERCRTVSSSSESEPSFANGTMMLATNTITASPSDPVRQRWSTPERMVSVCEPKSEPVCSTGRMLAGT